MLFLVPYAERSAPVNSEAFAKLSASAVRPDELFFHKYFNSHFAKEKQLRNKKKNQKKRKGEGGEEQPEAEVDSVDEEEESDVAESEINRILTAELDADFFDEDEDDIAQVRISAPTLPTLLFAIDVSLYLIAWLL